MQRYRDREEAGRLLATALREAGVHAPVVLGIPRGGVPVAAEVARALDGELGVVVARKLRAPGQPELAVGAITADGAEWLNESLADECGADSRYLSLERARQIDEARRREAAFDGDRRPDVKGRTVVIVDDGLATGATAIAAARSVKGAGAARVILAAPVAPPETVGRLRAEVDDVVCPRIEEDFWAIGQFYVGFRQVSDEEVKAILDAFAAGPKTIDARVSRDGVELAVRLRLAGHRAPLVTFVHGLGSSKDSPRNVVIAEHLVDRGIGALLFDLSGHGDSSRSTGDEFEAFVADLAAVQQWASRRSEVAPERMAIAGSSLGAAVALTAVKRALVHPAALVLRAPPVGPAEYHGLEVPTLLLVGSLDPLLGEARAAAAICPAVELRVVEGAGHLFEEPGTLEQAASITVEWLAGRLLEVGVAPGA